MSAPSSSAFFNIKWGSGSTPLSVLPTLNFPATWNIQEPNSCSQELQGSALVCQNLFARDMDAGSSTPKFLPDSALIWPGQHVPLPFSRITQSHNILDDRELTIET